MSNPNEASQEPRQSRNDLDEYQYRALRTWKSDQTDKERICNAAMGLAGEAGELVDLMKKKAFHDKAVDREDVKKEAGDVLYYLAVLCSEWGLSLADVATTNTEKLRRRYPEGFSVEASKARVDVETDRDPKAEAAIKGMLDR